MKWWQLLLVNGIPIGVGVAVAGIYFSLRQDRRAAADRVLSLVTEAVTSPISDCKRRSKTVARPA